MSKGFVKVLTEKSGTSPRGKAWTRYSFKVEGEDGNESDWITFGFNRPPFKKGDFIEFDFTTDDRGYKQVTEGTGRVIKDPPKQAAAQPSRSVAQPVSADAAVSTGGVDRQTAITLQHSQEMAISTVALLLANDALPVTGAKGKSAEAKRFEEIVASIDKLTVKFHNDVATGRLLTAVADMGVISIKPDAPLPAESTTTIAGEY